MAEFTGKKIDELTLDELRYIERCDTSYVLSYLERTTGFDIEAIRLMLELAKAEAVRRMEMGLHTV